MSGVCVFWYGCVPIYMFLCPSSPSSTILRSAYMALNTLQQDWLL